MSFVVASATREVDRDPGVGPLRDELVRCLSALKVSTPAKVSSVTRDDLKHLTRRVGSDYLMNWQAAEPQPIEFVARAIAGHLLDAGFSADHLHRWITATGKDLSTVADLAAATAEMVAKMPVRAHEFFVPCAAPFDKSSASGGRVRWLDGSEAAAWLTEWVPRNKSRRHSGGFIIGVESRDPWAAVEAAQTLVARADARVRVSQPSNDSVQLVGWARVKGNGRSFDVHSTPRQVEIGSLYRQDAVYRFDDGLPTETDDALELASYMESSSPGAAVTGGWAAIEALLVRPGEGNHHTAADRLASLVTCSLPRAELTQLAYRHMGSEAHDPLSEVLAATSTNLEKVRLVETHLRSGGRLALGNPSDIAAEGRILAIINDPSQELTRIRDYVTESLRRLYNQRNTISHYGSLRSVALNATTRTAFTLVGAGLDRIVHAQLESDHPIDPLSLVARAETELRLVGTPGGRELAALLD